MFHPFQISRRSFLRRTTKLAATTTLPLWFLQRDEAFAAEQSATPISANDRPGLALIGCGGQGTSDLNAASKFGNVVAVADVKEANAGNVANRFSQNGPAPATYT